MSTTSNSYWRELEEKEKEVQKREGREGKEKREKGEKKGKKFRVHTVNLWWSWKLIFYWGRDLSTTSGSMVLRGPLI